jgi:RNA polymerase sigma-70 factor (ECF subfamily)
MDLALVVRARQGDEVAFTRLAETSSGWLLAVARLILHDSYLAEDAVQDALIDAWRRLPSLREPERFEAWLRQLVVRRCIDRTRHEGRRRISEIGLLAAEASSASDSQQQVALRDELERGLRQLTGEQRAVLVLTYYLDLPIAESARTLGIPEGTMKSRLDRARSALRAALEAQERGTRVTKERFA